MNIANTELKMKFITFVGVDEVGRGCLAGPVISAAVYVKKTDIGKITGINDSKLISKTIREKLYLQIINLHSSAIGIVSSREVDKINIHNASLLSMKKALKGLKEKSEIVLVDGKFEIPNICDFQKSEIKGDQHFYSIAAASIVAKVTRDRLMEKYSRRFLHYEFSKHKGYGTKQHREEIRKFGICSIHRKSFKLR